MCNDNVLRMIDLLKKEYPKAQCSLVYKQPFELLVAGRLSSQCTDKRVNIVTKNLFQKYKTLESFVEADINELKSIIKPCGLFNTKAKNIIDMAKMIKGKFNGQIPDNICDLVKLPGIGRKTANLVIGEVFKKPAVICDTHCIRITNRLGLTTSNKPEKVESELKKILPKNESCLFCHMMVYHGRKICKSRMPNCDECVIKSFCEFNGVF